MFKQNFVILLVEINVSEKQLIASFKPAKIRMEELQQQVQKVKKSKVNGWE